MFKTAYFRYRILFPLLALLPSSIAYRLAGRYGEWRLKGSDELLSMMHYWNIHLPHRNASDVSLWQKDYCQMVEQEAFDTWILKRKPSRLIIEFEGFDRVAALRKKGHKVLLTSAHFGRFWVVGQGLRNRGYTAATVVRDRVDENVHGLNDVEFKFRRWKLNAMREIFGGPFVFEGDNPRPLFRAFDEHFVIPLFDVPAGLVSSSDRWCVEFMQQKVCFPVGPIKLAKAQDAYVVPFFVKSQLHNRVVLEFLEPIRFDNKSSLDSVMQALSNELEKRVLISPGYWWLWPAMPALLER